MNDSWPLPFRVYQVKHWIELHHLLSSCSTSKHWMVHYQTNIGRVRWTVLDRLSLKWLDILVSGSLTNKKNETDSDSRCFFALAPATRIWFSSSRKLTTVRLDLKTIDRAWPTFWAVSSVYRCWELGVFWCWCFWSSINLSKGHTISKNQDQYW